jgi:hypothetical protein
MPAQQAGQIVRAAIVAEVTELLQWHTAEGQLSRHFSSLIVRVVDPTLAAMMKTIRKVQFAFWMWLLEVTPCEADCPHCPTMNNPPK